MKKLEGKLNKLEEQNLDLQHQLSLNSKKQRSAQLHATKDIVSKSNKDVLKVLKHRLAAELSYDGVISLFCL